MIAKNVLHSDAIPVGGTHPFTPAEELGGTAGASSFKSFRTRSLRVSARRSSWAARLFLKCLALFTLLMFWAHAPVAVAQTRLTKLAPESTVVQLENGLGTATMILVQDGTISLPEFKVTAAVGSSNAIPEEHISFKWTSTPQGSSPRRAVLAGQISIGTQVYVAPNTEYKGYVIFLWPDAEQRVDFTVVDRTTLSFQIITTRLELIAGPGQPDTATIRVKNVGKADIRGLATSSSDMLDAEMQRRNALPVEEKKFNAPLRPDQEAEISFRIPQPTGAGLYAGTLDVIANGSVRQSIPLVLRSRGPVPDPRFRFLPFALFFSVLLAGFMLSNKLEAWFNLGGLQRAQALISLQESERSLAEVLDQVLRLGDGRPAHIFSHTTIRVRQNLDGVKHMLGAVSNVPQERLVSEAQRFATVAAQAGVFLRAVNLSLKQWPGDEQKEKLNQVLTEIDRVAPAADPDAYRDALRAIIENAAGEDEGGASMLGARDGGGRFPSVAQLRSRIRRMASLYRIVVAVVIFTTAYMIFYAYDFTFGTFLDYVGVFFWTLGLTQTGSQILARAQSTYTPAQ